MTREHDLSRANAYLEANQPAEALRIVSVTLASAPDDSDALAIAARAHLALERGFDAVRTAQRAVTLDAENEWFWRILSASHLQQRSFGAAREAAERAVQLAPGVWATHCQLAFVDVHAKAVTAATRAAAAEAVRLAPEQPQALNVLGSVALADRKWALAQSNFAAALRIDPNHTDARHNMSLLALRRGRPGKAAAGFLGILAENPNSRAALTNVLVSGNNALALIHLILWLSVIFATRAGGLFREEWTTPVRFTVPETVRVVIAIGAGLAIAWYVWRVRAQTGPRFRQFAAAIAKRDRMLAAWAALLGGAYLAMVVAVVVPDSISAGCYSVATAFLIAGVVTTLIRARRRRKSV